MNKGQMSFSLNGEFLGIAYNSESLKRGPIFAAVSLLHCAGCRLDASKPVPAIFPL
jgi:E3 ubiquitin-protein ligase NRDP1